MVFIVSQCRVSDLELRRLVAITRARNLRRNISGCLFWTGRYLAHMLEGPSTELALTVQGLYGDGRQADPKILFQGRVGVRHFNSSEFGFVSATDFDEAVAEAYDAAGGIANRRILLDFLVQEHAEHAFDTDAQDSAGITG